MLNYPDLMRVQFRCTRLTQPGECGLPTASRIAFLEGKVAILPLNLAEHFARDSIVNFLGLVQPLEPINPEEINWSHHL